MRILVAGGAGFLGTNLCRRLLNDGHDVVCLDNLVTGRRQNVEVLLEQPGFTLIEDDLIAPRHELPEVDRIYHLASPASPPGYQRHPIATLRVNAEGTRHLLEAAQRSGARFLFASTSEVYGDPLEHPQREDYRGNVSTTGPRSMYDEGKRYAEALVTAFTRSVGVDARMVRIFNSYGPFSDPWDGRLVPNFILQGLQGDPITVYGDGSHTRSLCYAEDTVDGMVRAIEADLGATAEATARADEGTQRVFNIGSPEEHTVLEYATLVRDLTGSRAEIVFTDFAVGDDPRRRRPDISRAREVLGWEPRVPLRDGLERTIAYFRERLAVPAAAT